MEKHIVYFMLGAFFGVVLLGLVLSRMVIDIVNQKWGVPTPPDSRRDNV
jgi:hypothetical protein